LCGWIYDEEKGCAEEGVPCGTAWADVVDGFLCPDCGVGKHEFATIEIDRSE